MNSNTYPELTRQDSGSSILTAREMLSAKRAWRDPSILGDNLPLIVIVGLYIAVIYAVHAVWGIRDRIHLEFYYEAFARVTIVFSGLFILINFRQKAYRRYLDVRTLASVLTIFLLAAPFNSAFVSFKQSLPLVHPFQWDSTLMKLDSGLHFGHQAWEWMRFLLKYPLLIRIIDKAYMAWFILLTGSCLWMAWTRRRDLRRCYLVSALLTWIVLGSGFATLFSSVGPCYYAKVVKSGDSPYAPLMERLSEIDRETPLKAVYNQEGLWEAYQQGTWLPFGGISAMPSIHVAIATLYALLAFNIRRWLGYIFAAYALLIQVGSVILGWHYAVDGYMGIALTIAIWFSVKRWVRRHPA